LESLLHKNEGERKMRQTTLVVVVGALLVVLTAGAAMALNQISCNSFSQNPLTPECSGTPQEDLIEGRDARDIIYAVDGDDEVNARYGGDDVYGAGRDEIEGGGHGPEGVLHYEDLDKLYGGDGNDVLKDRRANSDHDELRGGEGNDIVNAYDCDVLDIVVCGFGTDDTATFDADSVAGSDSVSDSCEHKVPR
jgi:Ca2+-binding RTX toxin-like protein